MAHADDWRPIYDTRGSTLEVDYNLGGYRCHLDHSDAAFIDCVMRLFSREELDELLAKKEVRPNTTTELYFGLGVQFDFSDARKGLRFVLSREMKDQKRLSVHLKKIDDAWQISYLAYVYVNRQDICQIGAHMRAQRFIFVGANRRLTARPQYELTPNEEVGSPFSIAMKVRGISEEDFRKQFNKPFKKRAKGDEAEPAAS